MNIHMFARSWHRVSCLWVLWIVCFAAEASAQAFPRDSGVINVRAYGARGDGVHDDTAALQAAIDAARPQNEFFWSTRIVYIPAGRYLVRDTLRSRDGEERYQAQLALIGDGPDKTRIELPPKSRGFGDPAAPKAVIFTSSGLLSGSPSAGGKRYLELGEGNDAYANYVEGLSIVIGRGNAGAVGIDFLANNFGAVRNVRVRAAKGSGATGIALERRWPGPLLISDVTIDGFQYGISVKHSEYGATLQGVKLTGQSRASLRNSGNVIAVRDLVISTAAVGIVNDDERGLIVADGLRFQGRRSGAVFAQNRGHLTLKPAEVTGASDHFSQGGAFEGEVALTQYGADWVLPRPPRLLDASASSIKDWVSVTAFGAKPNSGEDASAAIQLAFSSGAPVVYFPTGRYRIDRALEVPDTLKRIEGMFSVLSVGTRAATFSREHGMLRIGTSGQPLVIDRLGLDNANKGAQVGVELSGSRSLLMRDFVSSGATLMRQPSGGPLVIENAAVLMRVAGPAGVWASQLNSEGQGVLIRSRGTPLSILGLKTEQNATVLDNEDGQVEVTGGLLYIVSLHGKEPKPALINRGAGRVFAAYGESAYVPDAVYQAHFVQMDGEVQREVIRSEDLPKRGLARVNPGRTFTPRMP